MKVKVCPRCKHKNSPTYCFFAMCSMPLDVNTVFEAQRKAEVLADDKHGEYTQTMEAFFKRQ